MEQITTGEKCLKQSNELSAMSPLPLPPPPPPPPLLFSEPNKVQQHQIQTPGMLFLTGVHKLYGLEISRFLTCMLPFLDNLRRRFILSNYQECYNILVTT